MKPILAVDALSPQLTGIGRYTWELATRLPTVGGISGIDYFHNGYWVDDPKRLVEVGILRTQAWPRLKSPRWLRDIRLKRTSRGRVFHGPNFMLPACADLGVITVHDLSVFKFPETHPAERIQQFERNFGRSVEKASHVITDSEATRQEVISFLGWTGERVTAIPLGVSTAFAPHARKSAEPLLRSVGLTYREYALCVSTLEPRKKIDRLLQAYRKLPVALREQYPLVLAGSPGWLSETLHAEIARGETEGWLRYLGFVDETALPFLFAGARLFVYPSSYEGFGLPVLEAMASGVPVVTSNRSSLPEVTQGAALLVDPDDVEGLATTIETGLCDDAWRTHCATNGLSVAKGYSWHDCAEQTVGVYRRILAGA